MSEKHDDLSYAAGYKHGREDALREAKQGHTNCDSGLPGDDRGFPTLEDEFGAVPARGDAQEIHHFDPGARAAASEDKRG